MRINYDTVSIEIRKAKISDTKEISKLLQDTIARVNSKDYSPEQVEFWKKADTEEKVAKGIKDKTRFTCVATLDNNIVGIGALKRNEITSIYVNADHLREGIGVQILDYLQKKALEKGIKKLKVESSLTAFEFYKKHGFKRIKQSFHKSPEGKLPCIIMEKNLF